MNKRTIMAIAVLGLLVMVSVPSIGAWSINPAKWTIYARTSTDYEITPKVWPLEVTNSGESPITVILTVKEPQYTYDGYTKMPDLSWVSINETELVVPAGTTRRVMVTIDVVNATENYNQSMEFWIFADQTAGAGNIQTDYNCRWMYLTPLRYVPIDQRPGYIPWHIVIPVIGALAGLAAVAFLLAKRGAMKRRKPTAQSSSIREQRRQEKGGRRVESKAPLQNNVSIPNNPAPAGSNGSNIIKYKKKG